VEIVLVVVLTVLVVALVAFALGRARSDAPRRPAPGRWDEAEAGDTVVLDLEVDDPDQPSVRRLVQAAADRVLAARPDLDHVEVVDRDRRLLGRVGRQRPPVRQVALPETLSEPHAARRHGPSPVARPSEALPSRPPDAGPVDTPRRTFAARFDLPDSVVAGLTDPSRPIEVVRAVLAAAGRSPEVHGDRLVVDDTAVVVVDVRDGAEAALTHAFLRVQEAAVARGLVIALGYVDPEAIRRREAAAPHVRYVDADAIQRMADAVGLGADPLGFAPGPPVLRAR
jgi:hypothetical protein